MRGRGARGIHLEPSALTGASITSNIASGNALEGILVEAGNTANTFRANTMLNNLGVDARDDNQPANQWHANRGRTDTPPGTICARP